MMWSKLTLLFFVGLAFGAQNPGWKLNTEYTYDVRARTLASLHEVADQYAGVALRAQLTILTQNANSLFGKIANAKYAKVHSHLSDGWLSQLDDTQLSYTNVPMSGKQFEIVMDDGVIRDIVVEHDVSNWEANMIKSIVSQYQLDIQGKNLIQSRLNTLPENEDSNTAVFKTMEETVTGKTETLYDIHRLPEHILEAEPWLVRHPELKADGHHLEIVKSKNHSRSEQRPMYHYGFMNVDDWELASNEMGGYFERNSESRVIVSGRMARYTVQSSYTVDKIIMRPTLNDKQQGSVISMVNVTLEKVKASSQEVQEIANPIQLGGLVYRFNEPFGDNNNARRMEYNQQSEAQEGSRYFSSEERFYAPSQGRFRRSLNNNQWEQRRNIHEIFQQQQQPQMNEAPQSPLLPYTIGYKGKSIKQDSKFDVISNVQKVAQQVGREMQSPKEILTQGTLNRYTILTSLIRLMNVEELRQVARKMYTQEKGEQQLAWIAFRDAVSEAGTGPALVIIQEWCQTEKISGKEAAQVVAAAAYNARQPTVEYLRNFYNFIISDKVMNQQYVNETGLLAFTNLLRKVAGNKHDSRNQYPVHSFGYFYNSESQQFVAETVIPHLTERLHKSNDQADTRKIHLYIRALGNIGHQKVLKAFEPYLEGEHQSSQFQRVMMVVAMDKLVETHPELARSVLYRIYQNSGDNQEVRVAAVYQLIRTNPSTDMLQRMAEYTHVDANEYVSAAVKHTIESAAQLEGQEYQYLRAAAQAAKPFLTTKTFGNEYGYNYLRSYAINELKHQKVVFQTIGSEDSLLPKYLRLVARDGQLDNMYMDAMVSSIEELTSVLKRQTEQYKQDQKQDELGGSGKFSSEKIAKLLNMKGEEREQLEGNLYMNLAYIQELWSFDNHSIEQLPEMIRHYEQMIKNGKSFHYTKLYNADQVAIALPTEMGLPFLYTYDKPVAISVEGKLQGKSQPEVSSNGNLQRPEQVEGQLDLHVSFTCKKQGRLSFITPFDHQQYFSGFDKIYQVNIPIRAKVNVDVKENQVQLDIEHNDEKQQKHLFHYSTWPYTATADITNIEPLALRSTTHQIENKQQQSFDQVLGKHYTGIALRVKVEHLQKYVRLLEWSKLVKGENIPLMQLWKDNTIEYSRVDVEYVPEESTTKKIKIETGFQHRYTSGNPDMSSNNFNEELRKISSRIPEVSKERQEEFIGKVTPGLYNAHADAFDVAVNFEGNNEIQYTLTGAVAKSNVDPKSKVLVFFRRAVGDQQQYQVGVSAKNYVENTNGLDLTDSLKQSPVFDSQIQVQYGQDYETAAKIDIQAKLRRSDERKQYLQEDREYQRCQHEMKEGNHQLPGCANMTIRMNLLDQFHIKLQHKNVQEHQQEAARAIYQALKLQYWPQLEQNENADRQITVQGRFGKRFEGVNVTVKTQEGETTFRNVYVPEWVRPIVSVHPVFHLRSRLSGKYMGLKTYRPICVVDQTKAATFNYKTYPITLGNIWTVMLQYVPKHARKNVQEHLSVEQQLLENQVENFGVYVRENKDNKKQKDIKITIDTPQTKGKYLEIQLEPSQLTDHTASKPTAKVLVNEQEISYDHLKSHDINGGYVQIYALRNGEVKVEVQNAFYIIYDGVRVKLTTVNGKFRNAIRGLCGQFNGDDNTDFLTADNCIARDAKDFIQSYQFVQGQQRSQQNYEGKCYDKKVLYANVIAEQDIRNVNSIDKNSVYASVMSGSRPMNSCIKYQTRYVDQNGETCFTIRPMPTCLCQQGAETVSKTVSVHCLQKSNIVQLWKDQIDKGASPDFSHKPETRTVQMELPKECTK